MKIISRGIGVFFIQKVCGDSAGKRKIIPPSLPSSLRYCRPMVLLAGISATSTWKTTSRPALVEIVTFGWASQATAPRATNAANTNKSRVRILFDKLSGDDLGNIDDFHGRIRFFLSRLFGDHAHAKRTAGGYRFGAGLLELAIAVGAHPLRALLLFLPELPAPRAAAKTVFLVAPRLRKVGAGRLNQRPRRHKHAIVPAQIAGIVIGHRAVAVGRERESAAPNQLVDEFRMVLDDIVTAELGIFIGDRVKTMRACGHDGFGFDLVERRDILLGHLREQI